MHWLLLSVNTSAITVWPVFPVRSYCYLLRPATAWRVGSCDVGGLHGHPPPGRDPLQSCCWLARGRWASGICPADRLTEPHHRSPSFFWPPPAAFSRSLRNSCFALYKRLSRNVDPDPGSTLASFPRWLAYSCINMKITYTRTIQNECTDI